MASEADDSSTSSSSSVENAEEIKDKAASASEAAAAATARLTKEEKADFVTSLEHIITVGSHFHETGWKIREWKRKEQGYLKHAAANKGHRPLPPSSINNNNNNKKESSSNVVARKLNKISRFVHAEDHRIYPKQKVSRNDGSIWLWPRKDGIHRKKKRKRLENDDDEWDKEHGDGINVLEFADDRLSGEDPSKRKGVMEEDNDVMLLLNNSEKMTIGPRDVPNALLLRCWERAVHATSTAITSSPQGSGEIRNNTSDGSSASADAENPSTGAADGKDSSSQDSEACPWSYAAAVKKCSSLNIALDVDQQSPFTCPACAISEIFQASDDLKRHFYGSTRQRGCCWNLIRATQRRLVQDVLNKEVGNTADGLLDILFSCAKESLEKQHEKPGGGNKKKRKFNWQDVLHFFDFSIASAASMARQVEPFEDESSIQANVSETSEPIFEALQFYPARSPILLNRHVLESASRRLIERYADMPR